MALTSVNPNQPTATPVPIPDDEVGNGVKIPQTAIPGANPLDTQAMSSMKGSQMEAQAATEAAKSSKSSGGGIGGILGSVGGIVGKIFGGLFNQGGYVGMADGGMTYGDQQFIEPPAGPPQTDPNAPGNMDQIYGLGYAVGALHQRDFGGTPETLEQAAQAISQMLGGQQQFAGGGNVQQPMPQQQSANPAMQPPNPMQSMPQPQLPPQPQMPQQASGMGAQKQGFMQPNMGMPPMQMNEGGTSELFMPPHITGMATGGPPLEPGQPFMGEGEVNGPGGPMEDAIPAKLSDGEYVMSAPAVAFFGVEKMDKMNEQGKQGFMQSQAQVQANQAGGAPPMAPNGAEAGMPAGQPPMMQGAGMMPQMPPMQHAKGGPAMTRSRGSGFMG